MSIRIYRSNKENIFIIDYLKVIKHFFFFFFLPFECLIGPIITLWVYFCFLLFFFFTFTKLMLTEILRTLLLCNDMLFLYPKKSICIISGCNDHFERFVSLKIFLME